jgi:Tfp pilus assembly PilM family ATPase
MLWKNGNVNFGSAWAKKAWLDLLGSTLLNSKVRAAMLSHIGKHTELDQQSLDVVAEHFKMSGEKFVAEYLIRLKDEFLKETKQSLDEFFPEERANQLRSLKVSGNEGDRKKFEAAVQERTDSRVLEAMTDLADQLLITTEELQRTVDAD